MVFVKFKKVDHLPERDLNIPHRLLPFIWFFVRQMKTQLSVIILLFAFSNIVFSSMPYIFKLFIEGFERAEISGDLWAEITPVLIVFVSLYLVLQPISVQIGNWMQAKTLPQFTSMVRRQLALYTHKHSYEFFQSDYAGRLAGKVVETPHAMTDVVYTGIGALMFACLSYMVSFYLYVSTHWTLGLVAFVWLVTYVILMKYFIPRLQNFSKLASRKRSIVRGRFVDALSNIMLVKLFARSKHEDEYLLSSLRKTADSYERLDIELWRQWGFLEVITTVFWLSTVLVCFHGWEQGWLDLSDIAMILPLTLQITSVSWWVGEILANFFQRFGEIQEGMEAIIKSHDVKDVEKAPKLKVSKADISFYKVGFSYGSKQVFENFDLDIPAGQKLGLVGQSGAGKSTLVQILLRLFDTDKGKILIDGQDISKVTQDSLRENISVIPQSSELLHRTIRENIAYGRLDASDDEIIEAAKRAHAHEFIMELSDKDGNTGYDTQVGERGVKLSGGQRQRIAIARAVLKNAPILILDEATSALDSESERLIQDSLRNLMEGRTVVAIAHRLSTISHLDRLIVMSEGEIIEDGVHDELIKNKGHYAKLWAMQSGGFIGKEKT